ncbi:hypothetical protein AWM75_02160 [Aerococcus urinaehominis]|uniref:Uncharacterized protein n=1 Tax=Aerococcus urinaehominis TaxID=128944 RepID=A0A0X8FKA5_9LACT|nr:competence type IV pilus minor pilin ComGD [Aerococcus urinaehominis]AMB98867.1 hypothetical protein AWM75_02160 [Aerococcus urinaehominis]SDM16669.1 prepilin-type N-terminal cleavage/methylation domain-containing protein [Aerococcus urinaehominis]
MKLTKQGFTLLESLLVLMVVSLIMIAGLVFSNYGQDLMASELAVQEITHQVKKLQNQAILQGKTYQVQSYQQDLRVVDLGDGQEVWHYHLPDRIYFAHYRKFIIMSQTGYISPFTWVIVDPHYKHEIVFQMGSGQYVRHKTAR